MQTNLQSFHRHMRTRQLNQSSSTYHHIIKTRVLQLVFLLQCKCASNDLAIVDRIALTNFTQTRLGRSRKRAFLPMPGSYNHGLVSVVHLGSVCSVKGAVGECLARMFSIGLNQCYERILDVDVLALPSNAKGSHTRTRVLSCLICLISLFC
jgi:hypothetical protein